VSGEIEHSMPSRVLRETLSRQAAGGVSQVVHRVRFALGIGLATPPWIPDIAGVVAARIVRDDVGLRLPGRQQIEDKLHRQPGALDHRLTRKDLGIDDDAIRPTHALIIPRAVVSAPK